MALVLFAIIATLFAPPAAANNPGGVGNPRTTALDGQLIVEWDTPTFLPRGPIRWYKVYANGKAYGTCGDNVPGNSCSMTGLTNGQSYLISIEACNTDRNNTGNYCLYSSRVEITGVPCCGLASAPPRIAAAASDSTIVLSWDPPTTNIAATGPITKYAVTSNPPGIGCESLELTCQINGVPNGSTYTFTVAAVTAKGPGAASPPSNAVTPATFPSPPQNVTAATAEKGRAVVSWQAPVSTGGAQIDQYTATSSPGGFSCTSAGALTCVVQGLSNGETYVFTVIATNRVGASSPSAPSSPSKLVVGPGAPGAIKASLRGTSAYVSWKAPASTGGSKVTQYVVTQNPGGRTCKTSKTSCAFGGLTLGNYYSYTVVAFNAKGKGVPGESNRIFVPKNDQAVA